MSLTHEQKEAFKKLGQKMGADISRRRREGWARRILTPPQQLSDEVLDEYRNRKFRQRSRAWFNRD